MPGIDNTAMFKLSYGLFVLSAKISDKTKSTDYFI